MKYQLVIFSGVYFKFKLIVSTHGEESSTLVWTGECFYLMLYLPYVSFKNILAALGLAGGSIGQSDP